jgi:hypothetical protein
VELVPSFDGWGVVVVVAAVAAALSELAALLVALPLVLPVTLVGVEPADVVALIDMVGLSGMLTWLCSVVAPAV